VSEVRITVPGRAVPWQRPRRSTIGNYFTPKRVLEAETRVAWCARAARARFGEALVELRIVLWTKTALRGDLDNYAKTILDGLEKGQAIDNDRQVQRLDVQVVIGPELEEKVVIYLRELAPAA